MRVVWSALLCTILCVSAAPAQKNLDWVGSWACSQQIPEPQNALAAEDLTDATVRQIVPLSIGGRQVRVHVSNAFGIAPLHLTSVHIARPVALSLNAIDKSTDHTVTFSAHPDVTIPAGSDFVSDPIDLSVEALSSLSISMHLDSPPAQQTGHPGSRATSYVAHGDVVSAAELPRAKKFDHWTMLSGIDVLAVAGSAAVVALGDSITDGHGATTNGNDRWTDYLARRLNAAKGVRRTAVLNQGIGGNHLLTDGLGPNALARFDRDVLAQAGVQYLIVLEGVNDLGGLAREGEVGKARHDALLAAIEEAYQQIVTRAHAHHIKVIGATILPYVGSDYYHPSPSNEADRNLVNQWIRAAGHFDAVLDFDKVTADPARPERLLPAFDSGDHLHPSPAGYRAMADAIPLSMFQQ